MYYNSSRTFQAPFWIPLVIANLVLKQENNEIPTFAMQCNIHLKKENAAMVYIPQRSKVEFDL